MKIDGNRWRRLYVREEGPFALLPLYVRALAAELLKFVDDEGRLFVGDREPWEVIARLAGAEAGERRMLRQHLPILLADGFLVRDGAYLVIRNFAVAQGASKGVGRARVEHDPSASGARPVHDPCTTDARVVHDPCTKTELSARDDSEQVLTRARASERSDKIRIEETENPHTPQGGAGAGAPSEAAMALQAARPAQQVLVSPPAGAAPSEPRRRAKGGNGGSVPTSVQRYAAAYAAGIVDVAGGAFTPPTDSHAQYVFRSVLKIHAVDATTGVPLTGERLEAWIRASAAEYRRDRADRAQFEGGFKPSKWQAWLEGGRSVRPPARASPRRELQGGELDYDRIEATSRERAAAGAEGFAKGEMV